MYTFGGRPWGEGKRKTRFRESNLDTPDFHYSNPQIVINFMYFGVFTSYCFLKVLISRLIIHPAYFINLYYAIYIFCIF